MDDVTYGVKDQSSADSFLSQLRERFVIDEGEGQPIKWLLGMSVLQDLDLGSIRLNMEVGITKLAEGLLTAEELEKSKSTRIPMLVTPLSRQKVRSVSKDEFDYLSVVWSLLHIANCVRPDISLAVGILARHAAAPGPAHVRAAKRVVMYLYNTRTLGITYYRDCSQPNVPSMYEGAKHPLENSPNVLQTFADSDYAADDTRRSTMGMIVMLNGGPVGWASTLSKVVALSTCEAEVNAACLAAKEALHISRLMFDIGAADKIGTVKIAEDNAACIAQANSGLRHVRNAKHYECKLRFLQQLVVDKAIEFKYCPTNVQLADIQTKPLDAEQFILLRKMILGE